MSILTRKNDNHQVQNLRSDFDSLFDNFFNDFGVGFSNQSSFKPKVNISEDDKNYYVDAELAGIKKDDVAIEYANDILTIKAEKKEEKEDKGKNYHRVESSYGTFSRSVQVPNVDYDNTKAKFEDGVLKVTLPKKEENKTKITIE